MTRVSIRADGLAGTADRLADCRAKWQAISDAGRENARRHGSSKQRTGQPQEVEVYCVRNLLTANQGHSAYCHLRSSPSLGELVVAHPASRSVLEIPRRLPPFDNGMTLVAISSSAVRAVGCDGHTLGVEFHSGRIYDHPGVPRVGVPRVDERIVDGRV